MLSSELSLCVIRASLSKRSAKFPLKWVYSDLLKRSGVRVMKVFQFIHCSWCLHHDIIMRISWWSHLEDRFEVILNAFWRSSRWIFGSFWGHVQLKSPLGSSLRAFLRLEVDFPSSTPTILDDFGEVLGSIVEICGCLWSMLISSCALIWFSDDFS